jgi:hypothetical protein
LPLVVIAKVEHHAGFGWVRYQRSQSRLQLIHQKQDENDQQRDAHESAASDGTPVGISVIAATAAEQEQNYNNDQQCTHGILLGGLYYSLNNKASE